jgi:hypothetical protein
MVQTLPAHSRLNCRISKSNAWLYGHQFLVPFFRSSNVSGKPIVAAQSCILKYATRQSWQGSTSKVSTMTHHTNHVTSTGNPAFSNMVG